jgi:cytochrome c
MIRVRRVYGAFAILNLLVGAVVLANAGAQSEEQAARGKVLFETRCTGCHSLRVNREGPRLGDVFGRKAGSVAEYEYSPAMAKAGFVWNEERLNQWLTDTESVVPGNNMDFSVRKADERAAVVAYLKSLKTE